MAVISKLIPFYLLFTSAMQFALAETITISAERISKKRDKSTMSTNVFTTRDLDQSPNLDWAQMIGRSSGVITSRTGGAGQATQIRIRGNKPEHTLVIIDGVKVNDPMSIGRPFNMTSLTSTNIESIEILKGSQSVLYGSDAIGGVVLITTKKGKENSKPKVEFSQIIQSHKTYISTWGYKSKNTNFSLEKMKSTSFSASDDKTSNNVDADGSKLQSATISWNKKLPKNSEIKINSQYRDEKNDIDSFQGNGGDDPNSKVHRTIFLSSVEYQRFMLDGLISTEVQVDYSRQKSIFSNPSDSTQTTAGHFDFSADKLSTSLLNTFHFSESWKLLFGIENEHESGTSLSSNITDQSNNVLGAFVSNNLNAQFGEQSVLSSIGLRLDHVNAGDDILLTQNSIALVNHPSHTKLKSSYSTSYKIPSLYQLHHPTFGNKNLTREKSESFEFGIEQKIYDSISIESTYFKTYVQNLISFTNAYVNSGSAKSWGVENSLLYKINSSLSWKSDYTKLFSESSSNGRQLLNRPSYSFSNNFNYRLNEKINFDIGNFYKGKRDGFSAIGTIGIPSYNIYHIGSEYLLNKALSFSLKVENLFNKDYEDIFGYNTGGRLISFRVSGSYDL
jgi:vitamin B12 transporter